MLVTFREHAALDLCIFHMGVTMASAESGGAGLGFHGVVSDLFTWQYEGRADLWYSKC
jgi:hypothetical protein